MRYSEGPAGGRTERLETERVSTENVENLLGFPLFFHRFQKRVLLARLMSDHFALR